MNAEKQAQEDWMEVAAELTKNATKSCTKKCATFSMRGELTQQDKECLRKKTEFSLFSYLYSRNLRQEPSPCIYHSERFL